jgi:hypothetical protein
MGAPIQHGPITQGQDYNFFTKVTVDGYVFDPDTEDVLITIKGQQTFSLVNEGSTLVEYSFNGNTLHGDMTPGTSTAAIFFDNRRVSKIWFRAPDGGDPIVRVEAWSKI